MRNIKRPSIFLIILFFCVNLISSQSLVELAKREKERRARLKGRSVTVLTANTIKIKARKSALSSAQAVNPDADSGQSETDSPPVNRTITPKVKPVPAEKKAAQEVKIRESRQAIEERWKKAQEYVELLTLKMNALQLEFTSMDDMRSRAEIQRQIAETFKKLQAAQEEEKNIKAELDALKR